MEASKNLKLSPLHQLKTCNRFWDLVAFQSFVKVFVEMQQGGSLRKGGKRNLAKVNGLTQVAYDEYYDSFTGHDIFSGNFNDENSRSAKLSNKSGNHTALRMSSSDIAYCRKQIVRPTRDPLFNSPENDDNLPDIDIDLENENRTDAFQSRHSILQPPTHSRPYFVDKYTMQRLIQLVWLGMLSGALPWNWNKKEHKIEKWKGFLLQLWWVQWFIFTIHTFVLLGYHMRSFHHNVKTAKTYRAVFQGCFALLRYSYVILLNKNLFQHREEVRNYINTLFKFNKCYVDKYLIHLDGHKDGGRGVINCAVLVNFLQIFVSVCLFLIMPFQPWYMFSYIYPKPWYWLIPGAIQEFMVVGQVLTSYMLFSWMTVAHNNSVGFWLRETHNHNDSDYTNDDLRHPKTAFETYRTLQVLSTLFNQCLAPMGIPMVKIIVLTAMVPCGYVLIRSMNSLFIEEFPGILVYPLAVVDCTCAGFSVMSMSAEVTDLSCGFVDSWSKTRQKDFKRILMSCPTLKVWVGRFYSITITTTITFFKVIFDYITDCVITFP